MSIERSEWRAPGAFCPWAGWIIGKSGGGPRGPPAPCYFEIEEVVESWWLEVVDPLRLPLREVPLLMEPLVLPLALPLSEPLVVLPAMEPLVPLEVVPVELVVAGRPVLATVPSSRMQSS